MIKLIKSTFYNEDLTKKELAQFVLRASQLSFGKECESFERNFAKWQGRKNCVFLNSGSSANLAILQALLNLGYIQKGDAIGFSALTWSTNAMPIIQLGLHAIPIDIDLHTLNMSGDILKKFISTYPIKVLFLTNLLGFCNDPDNIRDICKENNILLIEDNCESLGTIYKKTKLGNFGFASTFSFYVGHHMSTIEGGAVLTDSDKLATMLRLVRAHGWDRNLTLAKQNKIRNSYQVNSTFYSRYTFYDLGFNLRPSEINGFLGNRQLKYLPEIIKKRRDNFLQLAPKIYSNRKKYYSIQFDHIDCVSNFAIPVICKTVAIRDELVKKCKNIIEIRPIVGGDMSNQPFFVKHMKLFANILNKSNARLVHDQGLYFGNNPELTEDEKKTILKIFVS